MNVLAIETATTEPAVALRQGGKVDAVPLVWREAFRETVPGIEELLGKSGIGWGSVEAITVPAGPGSFTGLRVGAALALALTELREIPLHAPPTLAAVAEAFGGREMERVCATLDARRGRRYAAVYERSGEGVWNRLLGPVDIEPGALEGFASGASIVGPDWPSGDRGEHRPSIAEALTTLVAHSPDRYRLVAPERLHLVYARSGVDPA